MNESKVLNLLGLAQRAGKLLSGDFVVEKAMKRGTYPLLIMASDCAKNNREKYEYLASTNTTPMRVISTKEALGSALGKEMRAVIIVNDRGFAKTLLAEIDAD